jgi:hypothetical protein
MPNIWASNNISHIQDGLAYFLFPKEMIAKL